MNNKARFIYGTNTKLLGSFSETIGNSSFIVRTRKTQTGDKLLIDVTEVAYEVFNAMDVAIGQARSAARRYGAASMDYTKLCEFQQDKKINGTNGSVLVRVRRSSYVFQGV